MDVEVGVAKVASNGREQRRRRSPDGDLGPWQVSSGGGIDPQWRRDGRELFFVGADKALMAVPVTTDPSLRAGTPTALFLTALDPTGLGISGRDQYVVAPDGTRFLLNQPRPDTSSAPVTMVVDWTAALEK